MTGFWYAARVLQTNDVGLSSRSDHFLPGTSFEQVYDLYLFDKKLRLLMIDALERIEIHVRSVIAHEVGRNDPLAYSMSEYINRKYLKGASGQFDKWLDKHEKKIKSSRDEFILWHINQQKKIPFWVAVETWDFGHMSKYYSMLNGGMQNKIINRIGLNNKQYFSKWLFCLNLLRNRCAHHSRIWNRKHPPIPIPSSAFFNALQITEEKRERIYSAICIIWYLVKMIGPSSTWIQHVANHINTKPGMPGCSFDSMGLPRTGFPRERFENLPSPSTSRGGRRRG